VRTRELVTTPAPIFSFNSSTILSAVFLPIRGRLEPRGVLARDRASAAARGLAGHDLRARPSGRRRSSPSEHHYSSRSPLSASLQLHRVLTDMRYVSTTISSAAVPPCGSRSGSPRREYPNSADVEDSPSGVEPTGLREAARSQVALQPTIFRSGGRERGGQISSTASASAAWFGVGSA